jgi:glycosyltransferase involved in cell wall biosynthesis
VTLWMLNHYAITPEQTGGTRHFSLAQALQSRGHRVVIVASNYDHFTSRERHHGASGPVIEDVQGVTFAWLPTRAYTGNGRARAMNMLDFARGLRKLRRLDLPRPDAVLGSSPHLFTPFMARRLARRLRVPFVLEIRDVWPQTLVDLGNFRESHPMIRALARMERSLYRDSDAIVSLLPGAVEHMVNLGAARERVTWIPNGIDGQLAPPATAAGAGDGVFTAMYAGTHGLANGLDTVLDAAKLLPASEYAFRLLGDGPEKPRLVARAQAENITNVTFLDPVAKREVYGRLAEADAFVMLLKASDVFRWGVSPNKLFDYMAMARPVIFAVNSSNSPVEAAGCGVRIEPDSPEALAQAMRELKAASAADRAAMGAKGRVYVEENHTLGNLAGRLEEVLDRVTSGRGR